jgi:threonine aldolase
MPPPLPNPALRARCARHLSGDGPVTARLWIERLAGSTHLDEALDTYGAGPVVERLEREVAELLGKEAGLFFHKGVVAQQAALLVHTARTGRRTVALHPACHIAADEEDALTRLAGLVPVRVGADHLPFGVEHLDALHEPLGAVTVELPLRNAAYRSPTWDQLVAISTWARARGVPLHLDGARLWEAQPWYGRPLAEIAALADTVYVSFYKGLCGMAGCVLAGPRAIVDEARPWRARYGGNLYTAFPFLLTALDGLHQFLPRMPDYYRHAVAIASAMAEVPGVTVVPAPPQSNGFQVHFDASPDALGRAAVALAEERGTWLFGRFVELPTPGHAFGELAVGEATMRWAPTEVAEAMRDLMDRARRAG